MGEFTGKKRSQTEHPEQAAAFTVTVRSPQCGHTVWETKRLRKLERPQGTVGAT